MTKKNMSPLSAAPTTGNGDIPETGSVLWRTIKNTTNHIFDELKYFIVGLGDTNYAYELLCCCKKNN